MFQDHTYTEVCLARMLSGAYRLEMNGKNMRSMESINKSYTNSVLATNQKNICVSRPRRFGKSITANMLAAYKGKLIYILNFLFNHVIFCSNHFDSN